MDSETINAIFVSIVVIAVVLGVLFFKSYLIPTDITKYGTYVIDYKTQCQSQSGYCSETGERTVINKCVPNPDTGFGCLNSDKTQTFALLTTKEKCIPKCRVSAWEVIEDSQTCNPLDPSGVEIKLTDPNILPPGKCVLDNAAGWNYTTVKCVSKDKRGSNACQIDIYPGAPPPSSGGCTPNIDGKTATCSIGTITQIRNSCAPSSSLLRCGVYGVNENKTTHPCYSSTVPIPAAWCYYDYINLLAGISQMYKKGYNKAPLECFKEYGVNKTQTTVCQTYDSKTYALNEVVNVIGSDFPIIGRSDFPPNTLSCIGYCFYYDLNAYYDNTKMNDKIRNLIYSPWTIEASAYRFLAPKNIPQSLDLNDSLITGMMEGNIGLFTDQFGNPYKSVKNTPLIFYSPMIISSNPQNFQINTQTCGASNINSIISTTSLICLFECRAYDYEPNRGYPYYYGSGYIRAIIAGKYDGYIDVDMTNDILIWTQTMPTSGSFTIKYNVIPQNYSISYSIYSIPLIPDFMGGASVDFQIETLNLNELPTTTLTLSDNTTRTITPSSGSSGINWDDFNFLLQYRQSHYNPYSCNVYYSYPPPSSLPPD